MTTPGSQDPLLDAINSLTDSNRDLLTLNTALVAAVEHESEIRSEKIHSIEVTNIRLAKTIRFMIIGVILLLLLAGVNFYSTLVGQRTANNAQQTNELLVGCFTPGSPCQKQQATADKVQQSQIRQTVFVISVCQRQNPTDPKNPSPEYNTRKLLDCIHTYYPDLTLPAKVN